MIVDAHVHAFPSLSGQSGHATVDAHMRSIQVHFLGRPVMEKRTRSFVKRETLSDGTWRGSSSLRDVNFRMTTCARAEWTSEGIDYAVQIMPPSLEESSVSVDRLIAYMDAVGVEKAFLHNARLYGFLNDFFAECVSRYPDRLAASAQIHEEMCDQASEITELRRAVQVLGMRAVHFQVEGFFVYDFRDNLDDRKFDPFWEEVQQLRIPVLWNIRPTAGPRRDSYIDQIRRLGIWARRWRQIPAVFTHGVSVPLLSDDHGVVRVPDELWSTLEADNMYLEILLHNTQGGLWDYPFPDAHELIKRFHERLGATKLLWGSDIPAAEKHVTYRQSLDYIRRYCSFLKPREMDLILGGTATHLFGFG